MTGPALGPLAGTVMLVTGGSSGIGRAIALAAGHAGADVALTYRRNEQGARAVEAELGGMGRRAMVLPLDLTDAAAIAAVGPSVMRELGRLDAWVNNAGADILTGEGRALSLAEKVELLLNVDLRGTMLASWQAAQLLAAQDAGGVIINMSWDRVMTGMAGIEAQIFSAAKGGVLAFSRSLARTVAPRVRVNVLAPGWIETSFGARLDKGAYRRIAESIPMQRWGTPDDVAHAAVYLASPAAAYVTGQTMVIGGGDVM